jgi:hypothetical protein
MAICGSPPIGQKYALRGKKAVKEKQTTLEFKQN